MSADFWAGYLSGATGIIIGNPLDLLKTRIQAGAPHPSQGPSPTSPLLATPAPPAPRPRLAALAQGSAAPILGYGALNALLFTTYNRAMRLLAQDPSRPTHLGATFAAGTLAGLATFVVSAPTELVKCRVQVDRGDASSWRAARDVWRREGVRGLYLGGGVTGVRDGVGYGFYYLSYELGKRVLVAERDGAEQPDWMSVLLCGGIAGVVTWASIFPLDVIKTRVQTQSLTSVDSGGLASEAASTDVQPRPRLGAWQVAKAAYREEGAAVFFRGLGVCSARAFVVNAVQWAVYEWTMHVLTIPKT